MDYDDTVVIFYELDEEKEWVFENHMNSEIGLILSQLMHYLRENAFLLGNTYYKAKTISRLRDNMAHLRLVIRP